MGKRQFDFEEALTKWESGKWPDKAALARHLGVLRSSLMRGLSVALVERQKRLETGNKLETKGAVK